MGLVLVTLCIFVRECMCLYFLLKNISLQNKGIGPRNLNQIAPDFIESHRGVPPLGRPREQKMILGGWVDGLIKGSVGFRLGFSA